MFFPSVKRINQNTVFVCKAVAITETVTLNQGKTNKQDKRVEKPLTTVHCHGGALSPAGLK